MTSFIRSYRSFSASRLRMHARTICSSSLTVESAYFGGMRNICERDLPSDTSPQSSDPCATPARETCLPSACAKRRSSSACGVSDVHHVILAVPSGMVQALAPLHRESLFLDRDNKFKPFDAKVKLGEPSGKAGGYLTELQGFGKVPVAKTHLDIALVAVPEGAAPEPVVLQFDGELHIAPTPLSVVGVDEAARAQ